MTDWQNPPKNTEEYQGFVYIITNLKNGRFYIGKSNFWAIRRLKPLKGKKRVRKKQVELKWNDYWGSSRELQEDIEKYGKENFARRMLRYCESKWEMSYYEVAYQIEYNVLFKEQAYNGIINCRIPKAPKKLVESYKK